MKIWDKLKNRYTRKVVYYRGKYREMYSGKMVYNYSHPGAPNEKGAMYKDDFKKYYTLIK